MVSRCDAAACVGDAIAGSGDAVACLCWRLAARRDPVVARSGVWVSRPGLPGARHHAQVLHHRIGPTNNGTPVGAGIVTAARFERATYCLGNSCSIQLSYAVGCSALAPGSY
jgi:hypothetical protein